MVSTCKRATFGFMADTKNDFCAVCGFAYNFSERDLAGGGSSKDLPPETMEILHGLGKEYVTSEEVREKSKKRSRDDDESD